LILIIISHFGDNWIFSLVWLCFTDFSEIWIDCNRTPFENGRTLDDWILDESNERGGPCDLFPDGIEAEILVKILTRIECRIFDFWRRDMFVSLFKDEMVGWRIF
jgi:hypothetical protein